MISKEVESYINSYYNLSFYHKKWYNKNGLDFYLGRMNRTIYKTIEI